MDSDRMFSLMDRNLLSPAHRDHRRDSFVSCRDSNEESWNFRDSVSTTGLPCSLPTVGGPMMLVADFTDSEGDDDQQGWKHQNDLFDTNDSRLAILRHDPVRNESHSPANVFAIFNQIVAPPSTEDPFEIFSRRRISDSQSYQLAPTPEPANSQTMNFAASLLFPDDQKTSGPVRADRRKSWTTSNAPYTASPNSSCAPITQSVCSPASQIGARLIAAERSASPPQAISPGIVRQTKACQPSTGSLSSNRIHSSLQSSPLAKRSAPPRVLQSFLAKRNQLQTIPETPGPKKNPLRFMEASPLIAPPLQPQRLSFAQPFQGLKLQTPLRSNIQATPGSVAPSPWLLRQRMKENTFSPLITKKFLVNPSGPPKPPLRGVKESPGAAQGTPGNWQFKY